MHNTDIINAMDQHAKDFNLEVTTIGQMAVQSRHAYDRIRRGTAHIETAVRIAGWLEADRAARTPNQGGQAA